MPVVAVLVWAAFQAMPFGTSHPAYALVQPALWPAISVNVYASVSMVIRALSFFLFGLGVYSVVRNGASTSLILKGIGWLGVLTAVYGLAVFVAGNQYVLWTPKYAYGDSLSATFISRNHYATFAGISLIAVLGLFLERVGEISSRLSFRDRMRAFWLLVLRPRWPWLLGALLIFSSLILSNSRAGMASALVGSGVMLGALAVVRRAVRWPMVGVLVLMVLAGLLFINAMGQTLGRRMTNLDQDAETRGIIFAAAEQAIAGAPLHGHGFGTFMNSIQPYQGASEMLRVYGLLDHAHNVYLELLVELGVPAGILIGLAVLVVVTVLVRGMYLRRRGVIWPVLGLSTLVLVGSHSAVDFPLAIPLVTLLTITIVATALAVAIPEGEREGVFPARPWLCWGTRGVVGVIVLMVCMFSLWQAWAALPAGRAISVVGSLENGGLPEVPALKGAYGELSVAAARLPFNPAVHADLGRVAMGLGIHSAGVDKLIYLAKARQHLKDALALSPADGVTWYRLAKVEAASGRFPAATAALGNSLLMHPLERKLAIIRVPLMLSLYDQASEEDRKLYASNLQMLWENNLASYGVWKSVKRYGGQAEVLRRILAAKPEINGPRWEKLAGKDITLSLAPVAEASASVAVPAQPVADKPEVERKPLGRKKRKR